MKNEGEKNKTARGGESKKRKGAIPFSGVSLPEAYPENFKRFRRQRGVNGSKRCAYDSHNRKVDGSIPAQLRFCALG